MKCFVFERCHPGRFSEERCDCEHYGYHYSLFSESTCAFSIAFRTFKLSCLVGWLYVSNGGWKYPGRAFFGFRGKVGLKSRAKKCRAINACCVCVYHIQYLSLEDWIQESQLFILLGRGNGVWQNYIDICIVSKTDDFFRPMVFGFLPLGFEHPPRAPSPTSSTKSRILSRSVHWLDSIYFRSDP